MTTTIDRAEPVSGRSGAPEEPSSRWEDFIDIFYAPASVFVRRQDGRFGLPFLVLLVVMAVLFLGAQYALQPIFDAEFQRGMDAALRANPQLTPEQMETGRAMSQRFGIVIFLVTFPLGLLLLGLVTWGVGKLFGAALSLGGALLIAVFSQFPRIVQQLVSIAQGLVLDAQRLTSQYSVSLSPARFLDADASSPVLLALLGRLDVFTLWATALLAIGLAVAGRLPKTQAYLAAGIIWLLGALPVLYPAIRAAG